MSDKHDAITTAKQATYRRIYQQCVRDIDACLDRSDHDNVWEVVCNGPDAAKQAEPMAFGDSTVPAALSGPEVINMCQALESYARQRGWNELASQETRARLVAERKTKLAGIGRRV